MKYLTIVLLFICSLSFGQTNRSRTYTVIVKSDANVLPNTIPPKDTAVVFTYRVYGVNEQFIYYWHMGQPTGDSTASYMAKHYIIVPTNQTRGYWSTVNTPVDATMVLNLTQAINAQIAAHGLTALTVVGALSYDSSSGLLTSNSYSKAYTDSLAAIIRSKVDTVTAKTIYYAKSNPQKFIPRDSVVTANGLTFNKSTLTIGTDGSYQTATQVNNAIQTALSAGGYASATSVSTERTRAQTAESNLSARIGSDSSRTAANSTNITTLQGQIAAIPTYTASLGVIKTGNNFTSDTTYNRSVANSFTKAQVNSAIATAIATIPVYTAAYGILKTSNVFSADTASATGLVSKSRLATNLGGYYKASNPSGYISGVTSSMISTALGYTPYNGTTNPNGYLTTGTITYPVTSVFGRTGTVTATAADYAAFYRPITYTPSNSDITTALGYTPYNGATNPNSYISSYTETDPLYTANGVPKTRTINGQALSANLSLTTDNVSEGTTNFYFTNTRARAAISALPNGGIAYDATGGTIAQVTPTISLTTRAFNTAYTISATRPARVYYTIRISYSITVLLGSTGVVQLQYSTDGGTTYKIGPSVSNNLNLGIALSGYNDFVLAGEVPAGALVKLVSTATNATNAVTSVEEVIY
jgi:hypothetical protein